jgi:CheY-like chemotaxis protein
MSIEQKNVLVVDDSNDIRVLLTDLLEEAGANVITCEDGKEAMNRLDRDDFDLVVTDILMPEEDGVSVIRSLKEGDNPIPVLAISGGSMTLSPYWLLKITQTLDVDAVLHKPFEPEEFLTIVSRLV